VTTTAIKERPILFSGPMVRAILDGRKTQTRRVVSPKPVLINGGEAEPRSWPGDDLWTWEKHHHANGKYPGVSMSTAAFARVAAELCPYGQPGERLWIREAWSHLIVDNHVDYLYRADTHTGLEKRDGDQKWKPSIHMPRVACRLMLEITGVRVERLNDISEADAIAEGCCYRGWNISDWKNPTGDSIAPIAVNNYASLWQEINGAGSWAANPWVWVVEFRRIGAAG
jgi:hypothetical protein